MEEIKIRLWRNRETRDWSLEVDGENHLHLSANTVFEVVEYIVLVAQQKLE
jgi:hypothetical protein